MNRSISEQRVVEERFSESILLLTPLLVVGAQKRSGLILCKPYSAEFLGPGAAVCSPFGQEYSKIIAIGSPEIVEVTTHEERQKAYSRRIQWVRWLNKIVSHADAIQRTEKLLAGFEEFFGNEILAVISDEVIASLAGVLPQTVTFLRSQYPRFLRDYSISGKNKLDVKVWLSENEMRLAANTRAPVVQVNSTKALTKFPFSA